MIPNASDPTYKTVKSLLSSNAKLLVVPALLLLLSFNVRAQDVISVGPMLHFNFGDQKPRVSWGIEAAAWWYEDNFPVSASFGYERKHGGNVLYLQGQTGVGLAGLAAGPYLEFRKDDTAMLGLQTDYWLNYFAGVNYRVRYSGEGNQKALGLYLKAPLLLDADETEEEEGDWDWD